MIRNYFTVAIRNLVKNKGVAAINILGLAIGMACVIFIFLYIQHEFSYDRQHVNANRIYRVLRETRVENTTTINGQTSGALASALKLNFLEVEQAISMSAREPVIWFGDKNFKQVLYVADAEVLDMFTIPFVAGDPKTALKKNGGIVLTEEMAVKFFGEENPLGKVIQVVDPEISGEYEITGVVKHIPQTATFRFDFLTATPRGTMANSWQSWNPTGVSRTFQT